MSTWWRSLLFLLGVRPSSPVDNGGLICASIKPLERNEVSFRIRCEMCGSPHTVSVGMEPLR